MNQLTPEQVTYLLAPIDPRRVSKDGKGFPHVEAWEIRRTLIRVFGHGGWSTELTGAALVRETESKTGRWTVFYRATVVLTIHATGARYHGTAIGEAINQPSCADAHDLALKTADSQAFKRAAVNLGDQFGLSLYDNGSTDAVVGRSLAYPERPERPAEQAPAPAPAPTAEQLGKLAADAAATAGQSVDAEELRAVWREADRFGLLQVPVETSAGQMTLSDFLFAQADRVIAQSKAAAA